MSQTIEIRLPKYPECWETCGNCGSGEVTVDEVLVAPGDCVVQDDTLIVLETGKVALDIPAPHAGRVKEIFVASGDKVCESQRILTLEIDQD